VLHTACGDWRATYLYIINGIRGPRMPRRRGTWLSTVPWVRGRRGGRPGALERLVRAVLLGYREYFAGVNRLD